MTPIAVSALVARPHQQTVGGHDLVAPNAGIWARHEAPHLLRWRPLLRPQPRQRCGPPNPHLAADPLPSVRHRPAAVSNCFPVMSEFPSVFPIRFHCQQSKAQENQAQLSSIAMAYRMLRGRRQELAGPVVAGQVKMLADTCCWKSTTAWLLCCCTAASCCMLYRALFVTRYGREAGSRDAFARAYSCTSRSRATSGLPLSICTHNHVIDNTSAVRVPIPTPCVKLTPAL